MQAVNSSQSLREEHSKTMGWFGGVEFALLGLV